MVNNNNIATKIGHLNIRGFNLSDKQYYIKELFIKEKFNILALVETKIKNSYTIKQIKHLFKDTAIIIENLATTAGNGIILLVDKNWSKHIIKKNIIPGVALLIDIAFKDLKIKLISAYLPADKKLINSYGNLIIK